MILRAGGRTGLQAAGAHGLVGMADAVGVGFGRDAVIVSRHCDIGGCEPRENAGQGGKTRKTARIVQAMAHVERHKRGI